MQISLPGSARDPGVWFVLAGFVRVAALTMSMGTSPFGEKACLHTRKLWMIGEKPPATCLLVQPCTLPMQAEWAIWLLCSLLH
jgi:hypothetical protein